VADLALPQHDERLPFTVRRWSGRSPDDPRKLLTTPLIELAFNARRDEYARMRQGSVWIEDCYGFAVGPRLWAPNLRTRW
jgi:hypothetical protein